MDWINLAQDKNQRRMLVKEHYETWTYPQALIFIIPQHRTNTVSNQLTSLAAAHELLRVRETQWSTSKTSI
jgi:hypothetical protein